MKHIIVIFTYFTAFFMNLLAVAYAHDHKRPDDHAPIGVMRDHVHDAGDFMVSYRFGYMDMQGNIDGTEYVSTQQIHNNYMVAPTVMRMRMHMFGAMYGITDQLTVGVMSGFVEKDMNHLRANNTSFKLNTSDVTDTKVNAMYQFYKDKMHRLQFNAGISIPTASIDERTNGGMVMAYPMQLGSGTFDAMPGISYSGHNEGWSWGSQINAVLPLHKTDHDYKLGNQYQLMGWGARKLGKVFSVSLRLDGQMWEDIDGNDNRLSATMFPAPTFDPSLQAGERINASVGINALIPSGILKGQRFAAEIGTPVYERLDGPRLGTDYRFTLGWQYGF